MLKSCFLRPFGFKIVFDLRYADLKVVDRWTVANEHCKKPLIYIDASTSRATGKQQRILTTGRRMQELVLSYEPQVVYTA